jgi:hypothetical protein
LEAPAIAAQNQLPDPIPVSHYARKDGRERRRSARSGAPAASAATRLRSTTTGVLGWLADQPTTVPAAAEPSADAPGLAHSRPNGGHAPERSAVGPRRPAGHAPGTDRAEHDLLLRRFAARRQPG